ncbi:hypothetical protein ACHAXH_007787 [Discostella pseudostelligera]
MTAMAAALATAADRATDGASTSTSPSNNNASHNRGEQTSSASEVDYEASSSPSPTGAAVAVAISGATTTTAAMTINDNDPTTVTNDNNSVTSSTNNPLCYSATCGLVNMDNPLQQLRERGDGLLTKFKEQRRHRQHQKLLSNIRAGPSLYDPSLYLCGLDEEIGTGDAGAAATATTGGCGIDFTLSSDEEENLDNRPIPASDLSDPNRTICVITTAAMPWRTGTAVNPLLRALYLVRYQEEERKRRSEKKERGEKKKEEDVFVVGKHKRLGGSGSGSGIGGGSNHNISAHGGNDNHCSSGSVVLVIPWLDSEEDRIRLYGKDNSFSCPGTVDTNTATINGDSSKNDDEPSPLPSAPNTTTTTDTAAKAAAAAEKYGMAKQEAWIRHYSSTACGMPHEATQLQIIFYPAFYLSGFGSIFPKVDLCNYIPEHLVDVAILEEPEHLNWFRMPSYELEGEDEVDDAHAKKGGGKADEMRSDKVEASPQKVEVSLNAHASSISNEIDPNNDSNTTDTSATTSLQRKGSIIGATSKKKDSHILDEAKKLGWTHRFRFVLGIVHTNYEEYARQYGIGVSLIAAPAIGAISALIIRAHCHQVIKLSNTLPNFAPWKEVTCNVHGVRREFLEGVDVSVLASSSYFQQHGKSTAEEERLDMPPSISPVYFIGKLVWAKGFDLMLDVQDIFRRKYGAYFYIDIYGGGPDEKAIARAFHGRNHATPMERPPLSPPTINSMSKESSALSLDSSAVEPTTTSTEETKVLNAAAVLANPQSIKEQSSQVLAQIKRHSSLLQMDSDDVVSQYLSLGFEVVNGSATYVKESRRRLRAVAVPTPEDVTDVDLNVNSNANPLEILGDLSGKSFDTGVKTGLAVYNIADSSIKNILTMSFSQLKHPLKAKMKVNGDQVKNDGEDESKEQFVFDPPVSRYEWRRRPIPAMFPGVVDHALLKNLPHKIFFNPSTSEVLCTTTAEALAMNKFVIIPKHPSNDFFVQFTNCLSYDTLDECANKIAWALENTPTLLTEDERRQLTWEGATERLMESSLVTVNEARERAENGMDKTDARIAYWLSESGEKSNMIRNLFNKNGGDHSPRVDG